MNTPSSAPPAPILIPNAAVLGSVVRGRRREQSLRIDDAASLSRVSADLLSRLENGKGSVRLDKLLTVLDGLGLALVVAPKDHPWMQTMAATADVGADARAEKP
jgi:transcriptional regulator with XRE-family HTH domain